MSNSNNDVFVLANNTNYISICENASIKYNIFVWNWILLSCVVANEASFCFACLLFLTFGPPLVTIFFSVCTLGQKSKNEHAKIYTYCWKPISEVQDLSR